MHLEQALKLKKGTKLKADKGLTVMGADWFREGKIYTLLDDANPIYREGDKKLRDVELSVINDRGEKVKITYEVYFSYKIVK